MFSTLFGKIVRSKNHLTFQGIEMIYRLIFIILTLASMNTFAAEKLPLEILNHKLVKCINPEDGEPETHYSFSLSNKTQPTSGILIAKKLSGAFIDIPVFFKEDGERFADGVGCHRRRNFFKMRYRCKNHWIRRLHWSVY